MVLKLQQVTKKLDMFLGNLFGNHGCVAVMYGSLAYGQAALLSEIDLMVSVPNSATDSVGLQAALQSKFLSVTAEEGIVVDAEVPL